MVSCIYFRLLRKQSYIENELLYLKGSIPGSKNSEVLVKKSVKNTENITKYRNVTSNIDEDGESFTKTKQIEALELIKEQYQSTVDYLSIKSTALEVAKWGMTGTAGLALLEIAYYKNWATQTENIEKCPIWKLYYE